MVDLRCKNRFVVVLFKLVFYSKTSEYYLNSWAFLYIVYIIKIIINYIVKKILNRF